MSSTTDINREHFSAFGTSRIRIGHGYYIGNWKNGERHGYGKYIYDDGALYVGYWKNDEPHGKGTFFYPGGDKHIGFWKDGDKHGQGRNIEADGSWYDGIWHEGDLIEAGKWSWEMIGLQ